MSTTNNPTGNVVMNPDTVWNADGTRKPQSEWMPANPHNIAEDQFQGGKIRGRHKFGKIFDDEAVATIAEEQTALAEREAETALEEDEDPIVANALKDFADEEEPTEVLNLDDVGVVLMEIKTLAAARAGGDSAADEKLLDIVQAEYKRPDGGRNRVKGALSAHGYKKPAR